MNGLPTLSFVTKRERTPFGQRLYQARMYAGLTQMALAEKVGMSQGTLAEAEMDRDGSRYTAQLAAACGVQAEWLADGTGPMLDPQAWPFRRVPLARIQALSDSDLAFVEGQLIQAIRDCEQGIASVAESPSQQERPVLDDRSVAGKTLIPHNKSLSSQQVGAGSTSSAGRGSRKVPKSGSRGGSGRAT